MDSDWQELIVNDGDRVRLTGRFVGTESKHVVFCGLVGSSLSGDPTSCPPHLTVAVHGLEPDRLAHSGTVAGHSYGSATVIATWRNGTIYVEQQCEPDEEQPLADYSVPCLPPMEGWKPGPLPSYERLRRYLTENAARFGKLWVSSGGDSTKASTPDHVQVVVVPVVGTDPEIVRPELSKLFRGNLCLVTSTNSLERLDSATAALRRLMADELNSIAMVGAGGRDGRIELRYLITTEMLHRKLMMVGLDLIWPRPSIRPAA
jgi:hypothetical protein